MPSITPDFLVSPNAKRSEWPISVSGVRSKNTVSSFGNAYLLRAVKVYFVQAQRQGGVSGWGLTLWPELKIFCYLQR